MSVVETVIVGGGPSGAAAACRLAAAGREVVVLERSGAAHHKVCGEFLSIETQVILRRLGVEPLALGAVPIERVRIYAAGRFATCELPFTAFSLSRYRLDDALLARAGQCGAQVRRSVAVQGVMREADEWSVRCDDGYTLRARNLVLATGKLGLRGIEDHRDGSLVGLKMHVRLPAATRDTLADTVELFMLDKSYVGLELVEDGTANLCLVMKRALTAQVGPGWPALYDHLATASPQLAARLDGAEPLFDKPLAVVCPDGGHLDDENAPLAYRIGDRLAHIPPFTGDGLAIAAASGSLAADHILSGRSTSEYLAAARALTARPIRLASLVSKLAVSRGGRALMMGAATLVPGVISAVARQTRLRRAALPMDMQDDSYAPVRARTGDGISARSSAG